MQIYYELSEIDALLESISEEISTFENLINGLTQLTQLCDLQDLEQIDILIVNLKKNLNFFKLTFYYLRDNNVIEYKLNIIVNRINRAIRFNEIVFDYLHDNHNTNLDIFFKKAKIGVN